MNRWRSRIYGDYVLGVLSDAFADGARRASIVASLYSVLVQTVLTHHHMVAIHVDHFRFARVTNFAEFLVVSFLIWSGLLSRFWRACYLLGKIILRLGSITLIVVVLWLKVVNLVVPASVALLIRIWRVSPKQRIIRIITIVASPVSIPWLWRTPLSWLEFIPGAIWILITLRLVPSLLIFGPINAPTLGCTPQIIVIWFFLSFDWSAPKLV